MRPPSLISTSRRRLSGRLLDIFIRTGLVFAMAVLVLPGKFSPFVSLMAWAVILAVTLYPAHQKLARTIKGKQGLAATLLVLGGIALIVVPTTVLMLSLGDSVHAFIASVRDNTLQIPAPPPSVAEWPIVGEKVQGLWSQAHSDSASGHSEYAAEAGRPDQEGVGDGGQHRRLDAAVPGFLHHCRDHHGLRPAGSEKRRRYLRPHRRQQARRTICRAFHGHHSCSGARCPRGGLHPGHRRRLGVVDRPRSSCRGAGNGCPGAGNRAGPGAPDHVACHRIYLDERGLRHGSGVVVYTVLLAPRR